jgi:hypothetical protein
MPWRTYDQLPPDVITLSPPPDGAPCFSATCRRHHVPALVLVQFGRLPGLWRECWGQDFAMCAQDWDRTRSYVQSVRPALVIRAD